MRVIVVVSPKGGAGKTTVATNLAVGLARRDPGGVVLVDLDVAFGDVASALLLDPRHSVLDALTGVPLEDVLVTHPSGLRAVLAPDDQIPDPASVGPHVPALLDVLGERFQTIVIDTGAGIDSVTLAAIGRATDLVLVGAMDVSTLLDLRKVLRLLDTAGASDATRHLVLNRADPDLALEVRDAVDTTGLAVDVVIPLDNAVARALNEGRQVDGTPAAEAFGALTDRFVPVPAERSAWYDRWRSAVTD